MHAYVLGDSTVAVVHRNGGEAVSDQRLHDVGADPRVKYQARLAGGAGYDDEQRRRWQP